MLSMKKLAVENTIDDETQATKPAMLSAQDLLDRWQAFLPYQDANEEAYKKFLYRLRTRKGKKHLPSIPMGKNRAYPLDVVEEWEKANIKNSRFPAFAFSDDLDLAAETTPARREHTADEKASLVELDVWLAEPKNQP